MTTIDLPSNLIHYMNLASLYAHQHRKRASPTSHRTRTQRTTTMSHTAFFYGTLMAPPVLHRVIWGSQSPPIPAHASLLRIRPAILHAHQRRKVRHADYPAILPSAPESEVRGTLVQGLTDGDIWRLDIFEGSEYERHSVKVKALETKGSAGGEEHKHVEGEEIDAQTYIWTAGAHRLEAEEWDFDHFVKEKMSRWVGKEAADEGFQGRASINDVDDAVAALQDPTGGRGANGNITRKLEHGGKTEDKVLESAV